MSRVRRRGARIKRAGIVATVGAAALLMPATGIATGPFGSQERVSLVGADGDANLAAGLPQAAFDPVRQRTLVVWHDEPMDGRLEIYGRFVDALGVPLAGGVFRISTMGANEVDAFNALTPDVVFNPVTNEFLVVWAANDDQGGLDPQLGADPLLGPQEHPLGRPIRLGMHQAQTGRLQARCGDRTEEVGQAPRVVDQGQRPLGPQEPGGGTADISDRAA